MLGNQLKEMAEKKAVLLKTKSINQEQQNNKDIYFKDLCFQISTSIETMINGESELKIDKNNNVFVISTLNFSSHYSFDTKLKEVDFFEHFSKFVSNNLIEGFKKYLKDEHLGRLILKYQYDGGGIQSWNEVYISLND